MELKPGNFRLKGHIDVPPERIVEIRKALQMHIRLTRMEQGCIFFNVEEADDHDGRFLVDEAFVDEAAFEAHQTRAGASEWGTISYGIARHYETWVVR